MNEFRYKALVLWVILLGASVVPSAANAQARGGPPMGVPGSAAARIPAGPMADPAAMPGSQAGPPDWTTGANEHNISGLERAEAAQQARMSKPQADRARELARGSPDSYELDRSGALAIRGEVMVAGLDAAGFTHLIRAGFTVVRKEDIPQLGMTLAVVTWGDKPARRAIGKLRSLEPGGTYAFNHVMFESGARNTISTNMANRSEESGQYMARIGLIDTGVAPNIFEDPNHRVVRQNFTSSKSKPELHGTAVSELLVRGGGIVTVYAADIFGSDRRGGTSELLVRALGWMAGERVPVINVSLVGPVNSIVAGAVSHLVSSGYLIVAPVGNDGTAARPMFPASYKGVIAVSAADDNGRLLPEASRVTRVDFVAPGIASVSGIDGREVEVRGTSFAAPIVSRLLAEHLSAPNPADAKYAVEQLELSARRPKLDRKWFGHGLVPADQAAR